MKQENLFCIVEIPQRYVKLEKLPVVENGDTTYTIKDQMISAKKMTKPSEIMVFKSKRKTNPDYPVYEMKGGEWSEWTEVVCYLDQDTTVKIADIQKALIKRGYDLEVDDVLGMRR